jgi:hypothetical protein
MAEGVSNLIAYQIDKYASYLPYFSQFVEKKDRDKNYEKGIHNVKKSKLPN